ncbi:MAG: MerR family transcriptional regulator [Lautropia sp.]|nr:MerR family transcriptional regulator [Lautropia sp.]
MRIGQFSERTGLSVDTLRYYEKAGLLKPLRADNGYRQYSEADLAWVAFIRRLKETAMPLAQIRQYSRLREQGDATLCARQKMLQDHSQRLHEQQRVLAEHQVHLAAKLAIYREMILKVEASPD